MQFEDDIHRFSTSQPAPWFICHFPPATRAELWGGLLFITVSLLGTVWVLKCRVDALALQQNSHSVVGQVVRLWTERVKRGYRCHVEYEFQAPPGRQVLRDQAEVPQEQFDRLQAGGTIVVTVCRTKPSNHQLVGERDRVFSSVSALYFTLGVLSVLALAGSINLWWWWISRRHPRPAQIVVIGLSTVTIRR